MTNFIPLVWEILVHTPLDILHLDCIRNSKKIPLPKDRSFFSIIENGENLF